MYGRSGATTLHGNYKQLHIALGLRPQLKENAQHSSILEDFLEVE